MHAFVGESEHNLDSKGRLIIPQRHRAALGDGYFLTKGLDGCLWLLPMEKLLQYVKDLDTLSEFDEPARDLVRFMVGSGVDGTIDGQGRLTIPPPLRRYAEIEDESQVVITGALVRLELWSHEKWEQRSRHLHENSADIAQKLKASL